MRVRCPWCGERTDSFPDDEVAARQSYVEDCSVCCRPIAFELWPAEADEEPQLLVARA